MHTSYCWVFRIEKLITYLKKKYDVTVQIDGNAFEVITQNECMYLWFP